MSLYNFSQGWYGGHTDRADVFKGQIGFRESELRKVTDDIDVLAKLRPAMQQIVEQVRQGNPAHANERIRLARQLVYDLRSVGYHSKKITGLFNDYVRYTKDLIAAGVISNNI